MAFTESERHRQWAEILTPEKKDMQGIIARGYNSLDAACYIMLEITNAVQAKAYFNILLNQYITTADKTMSPRLTVEGDPAEAVHIAFTSSGLAELQISEEVMNTFSREFIEGISYSYFSPNEPHKKIWERSTLLGDTLNNNPYKWNWGNDCKPVHCVLMLLAETNLDLWRLTKKVFKDINAGVKVVHWAHTYEYPDKISKEHFGFEDGISQPIIRGFSETKSQDDPDNLLNAGEFILGYKNEYDNFSPSPYVNLCGTSLDLPDLVNHPDKKDLGKNGCYMVFREIEQHVEKFWKFQYEQSRENGISRTEKAVTLASKMVGRWPDGRPLVNFPNGHPHLNNRSFNRFSYATQDVAGLNCPLGAHIRRTNPRDQVHNDRGKTDSTELSKKHRMLRRGRIYGQPLATNMDIDKMICIANKQTEFVDTTCKKQCEKSDSKRGLHFICMVSDISRQFEFVQSVWANTSSFADLCNEVDPIISPRPTAGEPDCHEFTVPQNPVRNRYLNVPEFTTVVGGAYFFMPGIKALRYILKP